MRHAIALLVSSLLAACSASSPCPVPPSPSVAASAAQPLPARATGSAAPASTKIDEQHPVDRTRDALLAAMIAKDVDRIDAMFSANMKKALPRDKLATFLEGLAGKKGAIVSASPVPNSPASATHAFYQLKAERGVWHMELTVANDGTILGMNVKEPPPPEPEVKRSELAWALPFKGEWSVVWGGDTEALNQHVRHKSQRRAADLLKLDAEGKSHKGEGKALTDYYAYGQELLAPLDGKVTTVIDGVPDSVPGTMNPYAAFGNVVVLEHPGPVYSLLAHVKPGSIKVKPGVTVKRGAVVGACGNSGNSTEPHLHFQVMDGPRVESSYGMDVVFPNVSVTREGTTDLAKGYTFLKGDRVRAAAPALTNPSFL